MTRSLSNAAGERSIPVLFDPESLGRSLREVAVDVVESDGNTILTRWFHSTNDIDLLIWSDENQTVLKQQVNFFGQVVEWNVFEGVKTGLIIEEDAAESERGPANGSQTRHDEANTSETIQFDARPELRVVQQAIEMLAHVPDLDEEDKRQIRDNLLNRVNGAEDRGSEFMRRYEAAHAKERARRPGFWRRLRRWFSGT